MAKRSWRYWEPTFLADRVCEMNPVWPWGGHRRFGYDLARWMRPARIAELGVHWGTSFFTFAQAMRDGRMKDTQLIGVDTFEGEEHAGHYGPEVLDTVRRIIREHFPKQGITVHQMLFSEALAHVEDESVDLLHIDGLHTFEAVKEDFESWLPKLAPEGVVLFHDVAPDTGYGSTDYWNQLSGTHPGFAFNHSWGLGVLFPKGDSLFAALRDDGLEDKLVAYPALARAERAGYEVRDLAKMAKDRLETINKQGETNAKLRQQITDLRGSTVPAQAHERVIKRAEAAERLADERRETIQKQTGLIRQKDEKHEAVRRQLEARAAGAEGARDELRERVKAQDERLAEHRAAREVARQRNDELRERNAKLREALAARDTALEGLRAQVQQAAKAQARLEKLLADMGEHVAALVGARGKDREQTEAGLRAIAEAVEQARRAGEAAASTLTRRLNRLDTDTELLSLRAEHIEEVVAEQRERRAPEPEAGEDWLTGRPQPRTPSRSPRKS